MKAILVIDIGDEEIENLTINYLLYRSSDGRVVDGDVGAVPKPMPNKIDANDWHRMFGGTYKEREAKGYGWNACIEELEK